MILREINKKKYTEHKIFENKKNLFELNNNY